MTEPIEQTTEVDPASNPAPVEENGGSAPDAFTAGWSDVLDQLPDGIRPLVIEPLKAHDRKYQELQENWNKVKDVPEEWRDTEKINQAVAVLNNIQTNPHHVLKVLAENLGVSLAEAKEIVAEEVKQQTQQTELEFSDDDDPRIKTMAQQIKEMKDWQQSQLAEATKREEERLLQQESDRQGKIIDDQVAKLIETKAIPNNQVAIRNLMLHANFAQQQGSRDPIGDGLKALHEYNSLFAPQQQANPAVPQNLLFLPTTGAAPAATPQAPDTSTAAGRMALGKAIADAAARQ